MNNRFDDIIVFVLDAEGGYDNDPDDPGGETKYGIDKRSHPDVNIKALTVEQAKNIYFAEYWMQFNCEQFAKPVGEVYFDCCVNTGAKQANKFLQRAVDTAPDGVIGVKTLEAVACRNAQETALKMIDQRQAFYDNLAKSKPKLSKFLRGWTNRNINLKHFITNIAA
jgi:lysozyme family protein